VAGGGTFREFPWEAVLRVRDDDPLGSEFVARLERTTGDRSVGVTDLVSLRPAFYRMLGPPVAMPPARQARIDQGRALHRLLGARLAREGALEARVRRGGLVGRIDLLTDVPVEVKTAGQTVEPSTLPAERPEHVEQLGMYCALLDRPVGRLLTLVGEAGKVRDVQAVDLAFGSPEKIYLEMARRADLLRAAWKAESVDGLPRCPWFGRGCEFAEAGVCSCTGTEPTSVPIPGEVVRIDSREDIRRRVLSELSEPFSFDVSGPVWRFREILYPRRAYFERVSPVPEGPSGRGITLEKDLYARLTESLESGPAGEVAVLPSRATEPMEEVVGFRGTPLLVRTSRAWQPYRAEELVPRAPQYALELGLRCALTGATSGYLVLGYERAETDRDRLQLLTLEFDTVTPFSRLLRERTRALSDALRDAAPASLARCPDWMVADCPYRSECGCGGSPARVTR
jgi:hypothetical protein